MATRFVMDEAAVAQLFASPEGMVGKELARRAVKVERAAKHLAPVDTGRLRASITHYLSRDSRGLLALIGSSVNYAAYQEFGTRFQHGQPYLRPALSAA